MALKGQHTSTLKMKRLIFYSALHIQVTNSCCDAIHPSLSKVLLIQFAQPACREKVCTTCSHFIHRLRDGRRGRSPPTARLQVVQELSLQEVTFHNQVLAPRLATCPAQAHLYAA